VSALDFAIRTAIAALNLVVFGLHALWPFRIASLLRASSSADPELSRSNDELARQRRLWSALAPVALIAAFLATAWLVGRGPDEAIAWGMTDPLRGSMPARLLTVALAAVLLSDLFVFFASARLDATAWRFHGAIGALALAATTLGAELLRIGWGPWDGTSAILIAVALRIPLALAAAEVVLGPPRLWTTAAGPALAALAFLWPATLKRAVAADAATLGAAALLLVLARFLPRSLRRAAALAGLLLALLFLERSAEMSRTLGGNEQRREFELESPNP